MLAIGLAPELEALEMGQKLGEFWKCKIGDYRIVSTIQDAILTILVVRLSRQQKGPGR
ncbi:type II toxin-antitoxin system RelE family toxin [Pseudomonas syringae pv. aptata]|uniref:Type II toxin-antitoxin system RelE/ParE family toxin n=1 Tax=Pseudomonas syringae pv. maculicola str. ES4326 TaxID=629265 RepID=A0A8T8BV11_PSEYM|nr:MULTISPECIES: type II toxin-antitoxin system RelE/ParE family toxin [Pseudomonas syringae group]QHE95275.1 type II toxin-antitoxin system RelE/ParE family toxin [Pseudomonas syringae pv. maculicola str. ES4326]UBY95905.1 type II toxin-antitoxin system RelE/ParE family toxin [Pseudomonas cannabina pv. alisalensis]